MSTQLAETRAPTQMQTFRTSVQKMAPEFEKALPNHITPEKFERTIMTAVQTTPELMQADQQSFWGSAMKCAQDGLLPDGREAALVIFNAKDRASGGWVKKVQYMPMVAGLKKKILQSPDVDDIRARAVFENDYFSYIQGDEERIEHKPVLTDRGEIIAVYAIAELANGKVHREVMPIADVNRVRKVSKSSGKGPWQEWYDEMAKKTVIRRISKDLPMSTDLAEAFKNDDAFYDLTPQPEARPEINAAALQAQANAPALTDQSPDDVIDVEPDEVEPDEVEPDFTEEEEQATGPSEWYVESVKKGSKMDWDSMDAALLERASDLIHPEEVDEFKRANRDALKVIEANRPNIWEKLDEEFRRSS